MKEMYTKPACEVTEFEAVDVMTISQGQAIDQIDGNDD